MKYQVKRKLGYVLVVAMLVVMIYPGELSAASGQEDGFVIQDDVLVGYVGAENAITMPEGITKIDENVFLNTTITSVEIPDGVTEIGDNAFAGCEYLTTVSIPESVTDVGENVFYGCTSLETVTWESSAGIPDSAFAECAGLTDLSISNELPSIGEEAFKNCESLESFVVPEATQTIAVDAFDGCVNMKAIDVAEENSYFTSYDNALYTVNGVTLYRCPQGAQSIEIYDGTKMIGDNAFYGCKLGTVRVPESVTTIDDGAFEGSEIQTLILGSTLESFGEQDTSFDIHSIQVPGTAPVTPMLVETYGAIVVTDYVPDDTEDPTEEPTEDPTEEPTEDPGTENPSTQTPSTENPSTQTPSTENPSTQTPSTENPSTQTPSTENPSTQNPSTENSNNNSNSNNTNTNNGNTNNTNTGSGSGSTGTNNTASSGSGTGSSGSSGTSSTGTSNNNSSSSTSRRSSRSNTQTGSGAANTSSTPQSQTEEQGGVEPVAAVSETPAISRFAEQGTAYITGDEAMKGWDAIYSYMAAANPGDTIPITMNGTTVVPKDILALAAEKQFAMILDMGNGIEWRLSGSSIATENLTDINFGVTMGTQNVPQDLQETVTGAGWSTQMQLAHDSVFGMTAQLTVNVGASNAGKLTTLFYYNEAEHRLEYMGQTTAGANGEVAFAFEHASDYVIVVDQRVSENTLQTDWTPAIAAGGNDTPEADQETGAAEEETETTETAQTGSATEKDDTPSTGQAMNPKYILCIGVMLLGIYMILTSRKEKYEPAR